MNARDAPCHYSHKFYRWAHTQSVIFTVTIFIFKMWCWLKLSFSLEESPHRVLCRGRKIDRTLTWTTPDRILLFQMCFHNRKVHVLSFNLFFHIIFDCHMTVLCSSIHFIPFEFYFHKLLHFCFVHQLTLLFVYLHWLWGGEKKFLWKSLTQFLFLFWSQPGLFYSFLSLG